MAKYDRCEICDYIDLRTGQQVMKRNIPRIDKPFLEEINKNNDNINIPFHNYNREYDHPILCNKCFSTIMAHRAEVFAMGSNEVDMILVEDFDDDTVGPLDEYFDKYERSKKEDPYE